MNVRVTLHIGLTSTWCVRLRRKHPDRLLTCAHQPNTATHAPMHTRWQLSHICTCVYTQDHPTHDSNRIHVGLVYTPMRWCTMRYTRSCMAFVQPNLDRFSMVCDVHWIDTFFTDRIDSVGHNCIGYAKLYLRQTHFTMHHSLKLCCACFCSGCKNMYP